MAPETVALGLIGATLALCYGVIYPRLDPLTVWRILKIDLLATLALLIAVGWFTGGLATRFTLIGFETNWIVFTLVMMTVLELPVFAWFSRKHDLRFDDDDDQP